MHVCTGLSMSMTCESQLPDKLPSQIHTFLGELIGLVSNDRNVGSLFQGSNKTIEGYLFVNAATYVCQYQNWLFLISLLVLMKDGKELA